MDLINQLERQRNPHHLTALVLAMDDPGEVVHSRAGPALLAFRDRRFIHSELVSRLISSPYDSVRFACAVLLMGQRSDEISDAYRKALSDSFDKVVQVACGQVASRGRSEDVTAMYEVIKHPLWRVKLEACKGLIRMDQADQRVVDSLWKMMTDPEAVAYDAEVEEDERLLRDLGGNEDILSGWGKLEYLIHQAMGIASRHQKGIENGNQG